MGYILGMDYARRAGHLPRTSYGHKAVMPLMDFCYAEGRCMHLAPGEIITEDIINYIRYAKEKGCSMQGTEDPEIEHLNVLR